MDGLKPSKKPIVFQRECPHCHAQALTPHEDWCRENIPLLRRIRSYLVTMISIGYKPETAVSFLSPEDRALVMASK